MTERFGHPLSQVLERMITELISTQNSRNREEAIQFISESTSIPETAVRRFLTGRNDSGHLPSRRAYKELIAFAERYAFGGFLSEDIVEQLKELSSTPN